MGRLFEILQKRSPVVHPLGPDSTVSDAVAIMAEQQIGAVAVVENDALVGIFSERDLLRRVVARARPLGETPLRDVMTPDPVTAGPEETRESAIRKMAAVGCRHLPVMSGGGIIDMLSMRDLLFVEIAEREAEIESLRSYIQGTY